MHNHLNVTKLFFECVSRNSSLYCCPTTKYAKFFSAMFRASGKICITPPVYHDIEAVNWWHILSIYVKKVLKNWMLFIMCLKLELFDIERKVLSSCRQCYYHFHRIKSKKVCFSTSVKLIYLRWVQLTRTQANWQVDERA